MLYAGLQYRFNLIYKMPIIFENYALGCAICGRGQSIMIFQNITTIEKDQFRSDIFSVATAADPIQNYETRLNVIILGY